MMTAGPPTALFLPLLFSLVAVFLCWLYYAARRRAREVRVRHARIYRCSVCRHVYVDARDVPLARCPRCACLNEAVRR